MIDPATAQAVLLAGYLAFGIWLATRMILTDTEITHLPRHLLRARMDHAADLGMRGEHYPVIGGVMRFPWRMPGEYWLLRWVPWVPAPWQLPCARGFSLLIGAIGLWAAMQHATELGGAWAGTLVGVIVASQATLVGTAATASYQSTVATLWEIGLWRSANAASVSPSIMGLGLGLVRHTAWPMAVMLWAMARNPLALLSAVLVVLVGWPAVWRNLLWPTPMRARRDNTVRYAVKTCAQRYESFAFWIPLALVGWRAMSIRLIMISLITLAVAHGGRALSWPKLVVGYLYDFHLPVVVALAVMLASRPVTPWLMGGITAAALWGLIRPRHPALPR